MSEDVIPQLVHNVRYTWLFALIFVGWPILLGLGASVFNTSQDATKRRLGEALYRSVSSYLGFGTEVLDAGIAQRSWLVLVHRMVGALAWAYVVAVFIASIG